MIDKTIHEPKRLEIMANLYVVDSMDFTAIKNLTDSTDGNLSSHLAKLEKSGYIKIEKTFKGKKPLTLLKLSEKGRKAFDDYRKKMKTILNK